MQELKVTRVAMTGVKFDFKQTQLVFNILRSFFQPWMTAFNYQSSSNFYLYQPRIDFDHSTSPFYDENLKCTKLVLYEIIARQITTFEAVKISAVH